MKKSLFVLFASAAFAAGTTLATAADVPSEATVLKVTGSVQVQLPGQSSPVALNVGDKIPQGATIITGAGAEAYIQPVTGTVATVQENSTVEVEKLTQTMEGGQMVRANTLLNLKSGNLVSTLDPAKRSLNNYGVRTPKGVAAARGTSYSVTVSNDQGFTVSATADTVTFTAPGGTTYSISAGMVTVSGGTPIPLSQAVASIPGFAAVVTTAVNTVANVVQNNIGGISSSSASNLMAQVTGVASTAVPSQAATFTSQAVAAVNSSTSAVSSTDAGAATAAVTTAAVNAVVASGGSNAQVAAVATAATTAAPSQAVTVASAAATAAPQAAAQVASAVVTVAGNSSAGAVTAVVQQAAPTATGVAEAVATATNQTVEQVQASATAASTTPAVQQATQATTQGNTTVQTVVTPVDTSIVSPSQ